MRIKKVNRKEVTFKIRIRIKRMVGNTSQKNRRFKLKWSVSDGDESISSG